MRANSREARGPCRPCRPCRPRRGTRRTAVAPGPGSFSQGRENGSREW